MSLYVEVTCDVLTAGMIPGRPLDFICYSHSGREAQGSSIRSARQEAKRAGWKVNFSRGGKDICPGCLEYGAAQ